MLLGQGNKFELWSEELWERTRDAYLDEAGDEDTLTEELEQISL